MSRTYLNGTAHAAEASHPYRSRQAKTVREKFE
jgi:hypothetical protein